MTVLSTWVWLCLGVAVAGEAREVRMALEARPAPAPVEVELSEGLGAYRALALSVHPDVRAAWHQWEASVHDIASAGALPEPTLSFAAFVQAVQTRVGPQQARLQIRQALPWPGRLSASTRAASAQARADEARLDATLLEVTHAVDDAYWRLWEIRETRQTHETHLDLLADLSVTLRSRVEVGAATLADLQQVDLSHAQLADRIESMGSREAVAEAWLALAISEPPGGTFPTPEAPPPEAVPEEDEDTLREKILGSPTLSASRCQVEAAEARVQAAARQRLPGFSVGADWILTGPLEGVSGSGQDAVAIGGGLSLPLWQGRYTRDVKAARARTAAAEARVEGSEERQVAVLRALLVEVEDTARRVRVTEDTLLPQAEAAYTSLLGAYSSSDASIAQVLLSQEGLLHLRVALDEARADHARAWAALDALSGEVPRAPVEDR